VVGACSSSSDAPDTLPPAPTHPSAEQNAAAEKLLTGLDWYRHAVFYEVNVRSFQDSNGDGIGDLAGLVSRLDYLKDLGVDALWLMPTFPTGFKDSGYDVADYRGVNPDYGDLAAMDRLVAEAHARKMRVFLDLVLNHTSSLHQWFGESRADKTNAKADWYVWSDTPGRADIGSCGPDDALFGTGWTLDAARNQYYFHRYYAEQPDLNYRNADVVKETLDAARFWLGRGVDGYRCDVIGKLYESPAGCDMLPETIDYIKKLRGVLNEVPDRAMVAEPSSPSSSAPLYGAGNDMFQMSFEFSFQLFWAAAFSSGNNLLLQNVIDGAAKYPAGAQPAMTIGSHDIARAWTTGGQVAWKQQNAALVQMTLEGTPFIYYGEEVGMRSGTQVVVDRRDSARTPMTWTKSDPNHGFTTGTPWIAFGEAPEETSVDAEDGDPESMLTFYRRLLAFRRGHAVWGAGKTRSVKLDSQQMFAYARESDTEKYIVAVNLTEDDQVGSVDGELASSKLAFGDGKLTIDGPTLRIQLPGKAAAIFEVR
jgi:glycosidase